MYFELSVRIRRSPADVFQFLRDKDRYPQEPGSPVLSLDKITDGEPRVGTGYREIVQMAPFFRGEIRSVITRYEPPRFLEEDFEGARMQGHLAYEFAPDADGALLIQRETLEPVGALTIASPLIRLMLARRLRLRLEGIKGVLESGWDVDPSGQASRNPCRCVRNPRQ